MVSSGLYTAAAVGFAIMALSVFHGRLLRVQTENEAHFRKMFEDAPAGISPLGEDGRILAVNRRWLICWAMGRRRSSVAPSRIPGSGQPSDVLSAVLRVPEKRHARDVEFELLRKDGRTFIGSFEAASTGAPSRHPAHPLRADRRHAKTAERGAGDPLVAASSTRPSTRSMSSTPGP
jgi:PAS domain-containing protein